MYNFLKIKKILRKNKEERKMTNVVLLGGNGYIGRNVTEVWLKKDSRAIFYVLSRSGKNSLQNERIHNIAVDVTDFQAVSQKLPEHVDYIVDFVGRPEKDPAVFKQFNDQPAAVMLQIAKEKKVKAMGFIGGLLDPKSFLEGKKRILKKLQASGIRTEVIEPTVVYGKDRSDTLAKLMFLFTFLGYFFKNIKPVLVTEVSYDLVEKMVR